MTIHTRVFVALFMMLVTFLSTNADELPPKANETISVAKNISDQKIESRLKGILDAAGTFDRVKIYVRSGVVFLQGEIKDEEQRNWVEELAKRTEAVVLVRNQLSLEKRDFFDLSPAWNELGRLKIVVIQKLPVIVLAMIILLLSLVACYLGVHFFKRVLSGLVESTLLLDTVSKLLTIPVFLLGLYLALRISGLTGLAFTVLGGTGLFGLAVGFGLKGFFENYIASLFISVKKPFRKDDWVTIGTFDGIVQRVTTRTTIIMDFDGNHVLIPNSEIFKCVIVNKTANPKMRSCFIVGIDYLSPIEEAQKIILEFLKETSAVLNDPAPLVLVDALDGSSVNLKVCYWVNVKEVSEFKISSYLRGEVKARLLSAMIKLPDPNREVVFTNSMPSIEANHRPKKSSRMKKEQVSKPNHKELITEVAELSRQAKESDSPDEGNNMLTE